VLSSYGHARITDALMRAREITGSTRSARWLAGSIWRPRGRSDNSGDMEAAAATTVGLRLPFLSAPASASDFCYIGHGHCEITLRALKSKSLVS